MTRSPQRPKVDEFAELLELVTQLIDAAAKRSAPRDWEGQTDFTGVTLTRIEIATRLRDALDEHLTDLGRKAAAVGQSMGRDFGLSYETIGAAAGMSRQAAHKRFRSDRGTE